MEVLCPHVHQAEVLRLSPSHKLSFSSSSSGLQKLSFCRSSIKSNWFAKASSYGPRRDPTKKGAPTKDSQLSKRRNTQLPTQTPGTFHRPPRHWPHPSVEDPGGVTGLAVRDSVVGGAGSRRHRDGRSRSEANVWQFASFGPKGVSFSASAALVLKHSVSLVTFDDRANPTAKPVSASVTSSSCKRLGATRSVKNELEGTEHRAEKCEVHCY